MFLQTVGTQLAGALFVALLALAAHGDLRSRRIPNRLVLVIAVVGLVAATTVLAGPVGGRRAALGLVAGLGLWLPLWLLGALGAGDVKLAAACGAWLGPWGVVNASLLAMVAGGVLAVAALARRRSLPLFATTAAVWMTALRHDAGRALTAPESVTGMRGSALLPYGVALAAGASLAGWLPNAWLPLVGR